MATLPVLSSIATVLAATACTSGGTSSEQSLSPADVGARELAGLGGLELGTRCAELPLPGNTVNRICHQPPSGDSEAHISLTAGRYAVVLLCEKTGTVTYTLRNDSPPPVTVQCGTDGIAVAELFTLDKAADLDLDEKFEGSGHAVSTIVKVP